MYTERNFKSKKALKEALANGEAVKVFQPGPFGGNPAEIQGTHCLEGPHYPEPHRFYCTAEIKDGIVIRIK